MNWIRSKKFEKQLQAIKDWTNQQTDTIQYEFSMPKSIYVADSIWNDIQLQDWVSKNFDRTGTRDFMMTLLKHPTKDITTLKNRQQVIYKFNQIKKPLLTTELEQTCRWFLKTPHFHKNYLYTILFPNSWYLGWVKYNSHVFMLYHYYTCYFSSISSLIYPLSVIITPYWYITQKFGYPMTFKEYLKMFATIFTLLKKQFKSKPMTFYKIIIGFIVYVGIYIYSLIQLIDLSIQLHLFRNALLKKIKDLCSLQETFKKAYKLLNYDFWKPFDKTIELLDLNISLQPNLVTLYNIFNQPDLQEKVFKLYKVCSIYDALINIHKLSGYNLVAYGTQTIIGSMKNPMLSYNQIANPLHLSKNLIISGPNAGGKTTYVKSLLWNIILGQSIGLVYGSYGILKPFDAILHHHRVIDNLGDTSLFQAEMKKLKETFSTLETYQHIIYFLDEPFHSTHPLDGAAMLKSVLYYFSTKQNLTTVLTSHYFSIQDIETDLPNKYINLSVKANVLPNTIQFNYHLYKGGSTQTIGIELLQNDGFPDAILKTATKLKNKLCSHLINV
jgi:hypothetical protein